VAILILTMQHFAVSKSRLLAEGIAGDWIAANNIQPLKALTDPWGFERGWLRSRSGALHGVTAFLSAGAMWPCSGA
jgi:hypothetical protein